jgi:hypothetical protein
MRGNIKREVLYTVENTNWEQLGEVLKFVILHKMYRKVLDNEWNTYKRNVNNKKFIQYDVNRIWRNFYLFTDEMKRFLKKSKKLKVLNLYLLQIKKGKSITASKFFELYKLSLQNKISQNQN